MIKCILGDFPDWAKFENPLLRYEVARNRPENTTRTRIVWTAGWVILLAFLLLGGYAYTTNGFQRGLRLPYTLDIWRMLFYPVLILQIVMRIGGLSLGVNAVTDERRRQTWDNLRSTEKGMEISLRSRWWSILFYRLRGLLISITLARIVLIMAILYELTSFQGEYLSILVNRSLPAIPVEFGVILLAGLMTAIIIMPITATGVDIALGLLIASAVRNRAFSAILQILIAIFRIGTTILLLVWVNPMTGSSTGFGNLAAWSLHSGFAIFGDWGLTLSQFTQTGQLWSEVPNTVFLGGVMLLAVLVQVIVTSGLLGLAVRIAESNE